MASIPGCAGRETLISRSVEPRSMPGPTFLDGGTVTLHPIERDDLSFLGRGWNEPAVRRTVDCQRPRNEDDLESWYEDVTERDSSIHFLACADDERVGWGALVRLEPVHGRAEIGYWIAPEHQGNGHATAVAELLTEYAVAEHRCHKVVARVFGGNEGSRRVLEKAGFEQEARTADDCYVNGERRDLHWYAVFADEWRSEPDGSADEQRSENSRIGTAEREQPR